MHLLGVASFPSSLSSNLFLSMYISIDHLASMVYHVYRLFSLAWAFCFESGPIRTQVCLRTERPVKQTDRQQDLLTDRPTDRQTDRLKQLCNYYPFFFFFFFCPQLLLSYKFRQHLCLPSPPKLVAMNLVNHGAKNCSSLTPQWRFTSFL